LIGVEEANGSGKNYNSVLIRTTNMTWVENMG
jgi:hypothetical protein